MTPEDGADCGPGDGELLVLGQIDGQALGAAVGFILGFDYLIFDPSAGPVGLTMRRFGSILKVTFSFLRRIS
jgi:hypothetical protein